MTRRYDRLYDHGAATYSDNPRGGRLLYFDPGRGQPTTMATHLVFVHDRERRRNVAVTAEEYELDGLGAVERLGRIVDAQPDGGGPEEGGLRGASAARGHETAR
jgi:hypothetical protein